MKKMIFLAAATTAVVLASCSKIKQLANINIDIPYSTEVSVPEVQGYNPGTPIPGGVTVPFPAVEIATNSAEYMSKYGTAANKVVNVYLKSLAIDIVSPPGQTFDFLDNINVYLSAPGLPEVLIASQDNVPKNVTTLNLVTNTEANLKEYYIKETISLRMQARINTVPPAGEQLKISSVFHMIANPLN